MVFLLFLRARALLVLGVGICLLLSSIFCCATRVSILYLFLPNVTASGYSQQPDWSAVIAIVAATFMQLIVVLLSLVLCFFSVASAAFLRHVNVSTPWSECPSAKVINVWAFWCSAEFQLESKNLFYLNFCVNTQPISRKKTKTNKA